MNEMDKKATPMACDIPKPGFYERFIQGDFGLAKTYWMFGMLVNLCANIAVRVVPYDTVAYGISVVFAAYLCALLVAIWNAARKYKGLKIWSLLAVLIVLGGLSRTISALLATAQH